MQNANSEYHFSFECHFFIFNAVALSRLPCGMQECRYWDRREARVYELSQKADGSNGAEPICRGLQEVDVTEWAENQKQDQTSL